MRGGSRGAIWPPGGGRAASRCCEPADPPPAGCPDLAGGCSRAGSPAPKRGAAFFDRSRGAGSPSVCIQCGRGGLVGLVSSSADCGASAPLSGRVWGKGGGALPVPRASSATISLAACAVSSAGSASASGDIAPSRPTGGGRSVPDRAVAESLSGSLGSACWPMPRGDGDGATCGRGPWPRLAATRARAPDRMSSVDA